MNRLSVAIASVCVASLGAPALAQVALIDREVFFGNPERAALQVSPDGAHISYLAPVDGVLNVWIAPVGETDNARAVTNDQHAVWHGSAHGGRGVLGQRCQERDPRCRVRCRQHPEAMVVLDAVGIEHGTPAAWALGLCDERGHTKF